MDQEHGRGSYEETWGERPQPTPVPAPATAAPAGAGRFIAALLMLVLAFGAGAAADRSGLLGGRGGAGGRVPPVAVVPTPTAAPQTGAPSGTTAPSRSASVSPGTPVESTPPASPTPEPSPTPVVGTIGPGVTMPPDAPANFGLFWQALQLLREHYVDQSALDPRQLTYGAIRGMLESIDDPGHTDFLTPEERKASEESLNGTVTGIGVMLGRENDAPTIVAVIPGGPADRAGIRAGDVFFRIDEQPVAGLDDQAISRLVRGPVGSTVVVEVTRGGTPAPLRFELVRERITVPSVTWAPVPGTDVAHIFVANFSEGATDQLKEALAQALDGRRAVILDLRQNPGGFVHEAVGIASQFLADGTVYIKQKGSGEREPVPVKVQNRGESPWFAKPEGVGPAPKSRPLEVVIRAEWVALDLETPTPKAKSFKVALEADDSQYMKLKVPMPTDAGNYALVLRVVPSGRVADSDSAFPSTVTDVSVAPPVVKGRAPA